MNFKGMKIDKPVFLLTFFILLYALPVNGQDLKVFTEQNYYTDETEATIIISLPEKISGNIARIELDLDGYNRGLITSVVSGINKCLIPVIDLGPGKYEMLCRLVNKKGKPMEVLFTLEKLHPKYNEVKINRLTGGLIVDDVPFFPFGFYCYSPVHPTLAEEEVVNGFNMMSPYQRIQDATLSERRAYMDRCAALGMKVHYNLLSVAGGGGVASGRPGDLTYEQKKDLLFREVMEFKDHPALLAWYMSDEPVGQGIPPEPLKDMYNFIKGIDPYHPVTMVFMTPSKARDYAAAMDIVMADPYPVPVYPVTDVERVTKRLKKEFLYTKPVFMVPQAFGGGEWWRREPTAGEIRSMTYQALVEGATGIQYFVRHGMNFFPKSVVAWNTCSDIAHEVAEISPELTMGEVAGKVKSLSSGVRVRALKYHNQLTVIAVNVKNKPVVLKIQLDKTYPSKYARLIFEDRKQKINGRVIHDMIDGLEPGFIKYPCVKRMPIRWNFMIKICIIIPDLKSSIVLV